MCVIRLGWVSVRLFWPPEPLPRPRRPPLAARFPSFLADVDDKTRSENFPETTTATTMHRATLRITAMTMENIERFVALLKNGRQKRSEVVSRERRGKAMATKDVDDKI